MTQTAVFEAITRERARQKEKWGRCERRVENTYSPGEWKLCVLGEELGEVARAVVEGIPADVEKELIHTAAVCVAWLESIASANTPP